MTNSRRSLRVVWPLLTLLVGVPSFAEAAYAASLAGPMATFTGNAAGDTLSFELGRAGSLIVLRHNRFTQGDPGFVSDLDFDSVAHGEQVFAAVAGNTVVIDGGDGADTLLINGSPGGDVFLLSAAGARHAFSQTGASPFALDIGSIESIAVHGLDGADKLNIQGTQEGSTVTFDGGNGDDDVLIDSNGPAAGGLVSGVRSGVTIDGGPGVNSITSENSSDVNGDRVNVTPSQIAAGTFDGFFGLGGSVSYANIDSVTVSTSNAFTSGDNVMLIPSPVTAFNLRGNLSGGSAVADGLTLTLAGVSSISLATTGSTRQFTFGNRQPVTVTGFPNIDPSARIPISPLVTEGNDGTTDAVFNVRLSSAQPIPISVSMATADGSATAPSDYQATSGSVTFNPGVISQPFTVKVNGDTANEAHEVFQLLPVPGGGVPLLGGGGLATILNDDDPTVPTVDIADASVTEGNAGTTVISFAVTLSKVFTSTVLVRWDTVDVTARAGIDYAFAGSNVSFAPGQTLQTISVSVMGDELFEPAETFAVNLSVPLNGRLGDAQAVGTINDDDTLTYKLAEGATGAFFDVDVALANPGLVDVPVDITFLKEDGTTVVQQRTLPATSRSTIRLDTVPGLSSAAVSTVVTSPTAAPVLVERTMFWDAGYYGSHTASAVQGGATSWFFGEGSQGFFDTYLLLANSGSRLATVRARYLREGEAFIERTYSVGATSRLTVFAGAIPELAGRSFSTVLTSDQPIVAERAMYFGGPPFWSGGHGSAGVTATSTTWYHAEGATGPFFDTYLLVGNPNFGAATVTVTYLLDTGAIVVRSYAVQGMTRLTVNAETQDPLLADAAFSISVSSTLPVISERAMYWPGTSATWQEGHDSFGVTSIGPKWGLAEGRVGKPADTPASLTPDFQTFVLIANPNDAATRVRVTFLRTTGAPIVKTYDVRPTSRFNVWVNVQVPELANESFGAIIESLNGLPIAVERAMYNSSAGVAFAAGTNATAVKIP